MKDNTLHAVKSVNIHESLLEGMFVQETLATDVRFPGKQAARKSSFGRAELRNIQRRKRPVVINAYDRFL